jgi:hypothetical protein
LCCMGEKKRGSVVEDPGMGLHALGGGGGHVVAHVSQRHAVGGGAVARDLVRALVLVEPLADVVRRERGGGLDGCSGCA